MLPCRRRSQEGYIQEAAMRQKLRLEYNSSFVHIYWEGYKFQRILCYIVLYSDAIRHLVTNVSNEQPHRVFLMISRWTFHIWLGKDVDSPHRRNGTTWTICAPIPRHYGVLRCKSYLQSIKFVWLQSHLSVLSNTSWTIHHCHLIKANEFKPVMKYFNPLWYASSESRSQSLVIWYTYCITIAESQNVASYLSKVCFKWNFLTNDALH